MHASEIIHRDIKLDNILVDTDLNIKVIDFGFAIQIQRGSKLNIFCGTPNYMSPEILAKKEYYGQPSDVWAAGIVLYAILNGTFPFKGGDNKQLYFKISKGIFEFINTNVSTDC